MIKTLTVTATAGLVALAPGLVGHGAWAANSRRADAERAAECRRAVVLMLYLSYAARERWVQKCIHEPNKVVHKSPGPRRPVIETVIPGVSSLGAESSDRGTLPSNAPIQPSAPVVGSSSNSISGSSANSTTGSSGNSLGSSGPGGGSSSFGTGGGL